MAIAKVGDPYTYYYIKPNADGSINIGSGVNINIGSITAEIDVKAFADYAGGSVDAQVIYAGSNWFQGSFQPILVRVDSSDPSFANGSAEGLSVDTDGYLRILNKNYTIATDSNRVEEIDPITQHYVGPEHLVDETNLAAGSYRYEFSMDGYKHASIQWNNSGGVTMTIWAANDTSADTSSDSGWEDVTTEVTGNASEADNNGIAFIDTNMCVGKFMIRMITSDSSNSLDVWIKRGN